MEGNLSRDAQLGKAKPRLEPRICRILGSHGHKDSASTIPEPQSAHHTASHALHPTLAAVGYVLLIFHIGTVRLREVQ